MSEPTSDMGHEIEVIEAEPYYGHRRFRAKCAKCGDVSDLWLQAEYAIAQVENVRCFIYGDDT